MYNPYGEEPRLNRFLLISVVLHAIVFLTFPELHSLLTADAPGLGLGEGGVIQIMQVESSLNTRYSPITESLSPSTVPRVTAPRPLADEEPTPDAISAVEAEIPEVDEPHVEASRPQIPEPAEEPTLEEPVEPLAEQPPTEGEGDLLTSELGPELSLDDEAKEISESVGEEASAQEGDPEASGIGEDGRQEGAVEGEAQSGEGTEESAPPAPMPLPSGFSLFPGGGGPIYPKDAAHDGAEGTVVITARVSANGHLIDSVFAQRSDNASLNRQAKHEVDGATWPQMDYDYEVDVQFIYSSDNFSSSVAYSEARSLATP